MAENIFYRNSLGLTFFYGINALSMCSPKIKVLLASERSEWDTTRGVQIRAGAVYVYIYIYLYHITSL